MVWLCHFESRRNQRRIGKVYYGTQNFRHSRKDARRIRAVIRGEAVGWQGGEALGGGGKGTTLINVKEITVEPLFRGHSRDQGKCPLNRGVPWRGLLIISQQSKYFSLFSSFSASEFAAVNHGNLSLRRWVFFFSNFYKFSVLLT